MQWQFAGSLLFLVLAFVTDIRTMKIPNWINFSYILTGFLYQGLTNGLDGLWFGAKGFIVGFGIMFLLYVFGAVGGGDVKLFGGIGAWTGLAFTTSSLVYSMIAAGVIGLGILLFRREVIRRMVHFWKSVYGAVLLRSVGPIQHAQKDMIKFPFMVAILPGTILAYLYT